MPRFVVLHHTDWPDHADHWDLMLEQREALATWSLTSLPAPGLTAEARQLPDHRLMYLEYEGPVSADRGRVRRQASGSYEWIHDEPARKVIRLRGTAVKGLVMNGVLSLTQLAADADGMTQRWTLEFTSIP